MQRNINSLTGFSVGATDGEIGKVKEFYFEDNTWKVRYLVVKTGNWFSDHQVLITPDVLVKDSQERGIFTSNLTKEQVRTSPDIDTDKPVSRRQEIELYGHYEWQPYWGSGFYAGGFANIPQTPFVVEKPMIDEKIITSTGNSDERNEDDPHLRSTKKVTGYHIHATDGDIGHVHDFILDDQTWQIVYLVVDTHNYIGGKKVLVAVDHVKEIQWENFKVLLDVSVDAVKNTTADDKWKNNDPANGGTDDKKRIYELDKDLEKYH